VLAAAGGNFKDGCAVLERPLHDVAPEFAVREGRAGQRTRYREYLCPLTGLRVDSEILKEGDEALHDIEIARGARERDLLVGVAVAAPAREGLGA
jgi:N-methylhydantoinase B